MEESNEIVDPEVQQYDQLLLLRNWFNVHKDELRIVNSNKNYRSEDKTLILPFFEKEPDWTKFHIYEWNDGRKVYEVSLANKEMVFTEQFMENMPYTDPVKTVIQNILFVENKENGRFDPVIARYYPADVYSIQSFEEISYNQIGAGWSGTVDIWTYDEHYFVGFIIEDGRIVTTKHPQWYFDDTNTRIKKSSVENLSVICYLVRDVWYTTVTGGGISYTTSTVENMYFQCYGYTELDYNWQNANTPNPYTGGGGGTANIGYTPPVIVKPDFQINYGDLSDCHINLINSLIGSTQGEFQRIFKKFSGDNPVPINYNIRFGYGNCPNGATACVSRYLNDESAVITINKDVNKNATDLSFARTILHETLHAYLLFEEKFRLNCDLNCLILKYIEKYGDRDMNPVHHNLFVESKFLNDIAVELRNFAQESGYILNTIGNQYFVDMAWGGLDKTDLFEKKSTLEKNRIINTIGAELYNKNYNGTYPKGIKACE